MNRPSTFPFSSSLPSESIKIALDDPKRSSFRAVGLADVIGEILGWEVVLSVAGPPFPDSPSCSLGGEAGNLAKKLVILEVFITPKGYAMETAKGFGRDKQTRQLSRFLPPALSLTHPIFTLFKCTLRWSPIPISSMPKASRSYYYAVRVGRTPGIYDSW
jgi:hypothetical protein